MTGTCCLCNTELKDCAIMNCTICEREDRYCFKCSRHCVHGSMKVLLLDS